MTISELCEMLMLCMFGASWPINAIKSYKVRTARGKSLPFLLLILVGYIFGIAAKLSAPSFKWYVLLIYVLNMSMVGVDLLLYVRNSRLDKLRQ